ncbi:solute carrier family 22 member 21-like [Mytilus trossulus]|uniref:solute carrier family 22 member 21-like n=1 Tax=Mytilus trossulus TaxID=6551 RepID=UPI003005C1AF
MMFFIIASLAGVAVGVIQLLEIPNKGHLINGFALTSKLGVAAGWASLMLLTSESFPTVVRNIGYGIQNSVSRIGAMIAPQIVYVSQRTSGVMYFLCGGVMFISMLCLIGVSETGKKSLTDTIEKKEKMYTKSDVRVKTKTTKDNKRFECEYSSHL